LVDAIDVIKAHPFLGQGLGSTLVFEETGGLVKEVAAIDQGFAYVMSKFGILGLASFYGLVYSVFKRSGWPETNRVHIATFVLFIFSIAFMVSHPVMLQFIGAGFVGIIAGLLCRARSLRPGPRSQ
jgi:hypothetical protein